MVDSLAHISFRLFQALPEVVKMAKQRVVGYLNHHHVTFSTHRQPSAFTAQEVAEQAQISGHNLAKTVMISLNF